MLLHWCKFSGQGETTPNLDDYDYMEGANSHSLEGSNYIPKSNCLNILYYNARSLLPKMDELRALVDIQQPHIVRIVETWLSCEILDNEIFLQGYQVLRLDRNHHGGGILMFVHESLVPKVVACGPCDLEFLLISLCNRVSSCKYHVGLFIDHLPVVSKVCRVCILILKD